MHLSHLLVLLKVVKHTATKECTWIATPLGHGSLGTTAPLCTGHRLFCWNLPRAASTRATSTKQLVLPCKLMTFLFICSLFYFASVTLDFILPKFYLLNFLRYSNKENRWTLDGPVYWQTFFLSKEAEQIQKSHCLSFSISFSAFILKKKSLFRQC